MTGNNTYKIKLKKGDPVIIITGKHKGKISRIIATYPTKNSVTVENVNVVKRHIKPNKQHPQGGIIDIAKPIDVSNVAYYDESKKVASKIGYRVSPDHKKRIAKKTGKEIK